MIILRSINMIKFNNIELQNIVKNNSFSVHTANDPDYPDKKAIVIIDNMINQQLVAGSFEIDETVTMDNVEQHLLNLTLDYLSN